MASLSDDAQTVPRAGIATLLADEAGGTKSVFALLGKLPLLRRQNQRLAHIRRKHAPLFLLNLPSR
jgi:hypothetical protein